MTHGATPGNLPEHASRKTRLDQTDDPGEYEAEDLADDAGADDPTTDPEAPEADAVEQRTAIEEETAPVGPRAPGVALDANEADVLEQEQVVHLDEDDYR